MQAAVGDEFALDCKDIDLFKEVHQGIFDNKFDILPRKEYVNHYDLHIKVEAGENQVELFHQAFCK